jgi:hypothetical protein
MIINPQGEVHNPLNQVPGLNPNPETAGGWQILVTHTHTQRAASTIVGRRRHAARPLDAYGLRQQGLDAYCLRA